MVVTKISQNTSHCSKCPFPGIISIQLAFFQNHNSHQRYLKMPLMAVAICFLMDSVTREDLVMPLWASSQDTVFLALYQKMSTLFVCFSLSTSQAILFFFCALAAATMYMYSTLTVLSWKLKINRTPIRWDLMSTFLFPFVNIVDLLYITHLLRQ